MIDCVTGLTCMLWSNRNQWWSLSWSALPLGMTSGKSTIMSSYTCD
jgi:hypothetical protein